jgi:AcrR family transcriptional regulator
MVGQLPDPDGRRLPRGRHGLPRGEVIEHQRRRLIEAVPLAVYEKSFASVTVEDISAHAGVSRRTFYENFRDAEDCFVASYQQHTQELMTVIGGAAAAGQDWVQRARFGLQALLRYLAERPELAHMAVIEVLAAGPAALSERDQAVVQLTSLIGDEVHAANPDSPPDLLLEVIAGAILQLIYAWVLVGDSEQLEALLPTIMYMVLVASHGPAEAAMQAGLVTAELARD